MWALSACITPLFNLVLLAPSANATLPSHPRLQTSYSSSIYFVPPPSNPMMFLAIFLYLLLPFLIRSEFLNGMLEVFEPEALNYYTLSCLILWIFSVSRNPNNSTSSFRFPGFVAVKSDRTHSWSDNLSPDDPHVSGGANVFVRQGPFFSEHTTTSISSLDPYSDYVGINISLNNSSSLSFLVYVPPIRSSSSYRRTDSF